MPITLTSSDNSGHKLTAIKGCPVRYYFSTDSYFEPVFTTFYYEIGPITVSDIVTDVVREYNIGAYTTRFTQTLGSPKTDIIYSPGMSLTDLLASTQNVLEGLLREDYVVECELRNSDTELWIVLEAKCKGVAGATRIREYKQSSNTTVVLDDYSGINVAGVGGVRKDYKVKLQVYINDLYQHDIFLVPQGSMCYTQNPDAIAMCIDIRTLLENYIYTTLPTMEGGFNILPSPNSIKSFSWSVYDIWGKFVGDTQEGLCDAWDAASDAYINRTDISITNLMTIEYWIHLRGDGTQGVLGRLTGSSGIQYIGGAPIFHTGGGNSVTFPAIPTNQWVHQAFTINLAASTNNITYYQDGALITTSSVVVGDNPYLFGVLGSYNLSSFFTGDLAEFRVFQSIRGSTDIQDNYDKEISAATPNLQVYYQWKEEDSSTVVDSTAFNRDANHITVSSASPTLYSKGIGPTCFSTSYTEQAPEIGSISDPKLFLNALCDNGDSDMSAYAFVNSSTLVKPLLILPEDNTFDICHGQPEVVYFYIPEEFNLLFPKLRLVDGSSNVLGEDVFSFQLNSHKNNIHYVDLTDALDALEIGGTATLEWVDTGIYGQYMEPIYYHKLSSSTDDCCCTGYFIFLNPVGGYQVFPTSCTRDYGIEIDASTYYVCEGCNNNIAVGQRFTNLTWSRRKRVFSRKMALTTYTKKLVEAFFSSGDIRWYENGQLLPIRFNQNTRAIQVNKNTIQFEMTFNVAKTYTSLINS